MRLHIYPVILDLVRELAPVLESLRVRSPALADQMERALISVPLNVAEGAYSRGRSQSLRFQTAAASAREVLACLETAEAMGYMDPVPPKPTGKATRRPKACRDNVVVVEELIDGASADPTSHKNRRARRILILGQRKSHGAKSAPQQNKTRTILASATGFV